MRPYRLGYCRVPLPPVTIPVRSLIVGDAGLGTAMWVRIGEVICLKIGGSCRQLLYVNQVDRTF